MPCITSDWVFDCIEKGHCLPTDDYRVDNLNPREKVSTPEKTDVTMAKLQEVSMCSTILHPNDQTTTTKTVNETQGNNFHRVEKREMYSFLPPLRFYVKSISVKSKNSHDGHLRKYYSVVRLYRTICI